MSLLAFTHFLNGFLMIALPIGLGIFLTRRFRLGWRLWWIGAATFVLSQVGHIPFNWIVTRLFTLGMLPSPPASWQPLFNAIFLGLSAGLWEELFRAGVYRWWATDARSWRKGILMGAGHGGIESIITGALVLNVFINMLILRGPDAARLVPPEQMALVQKQLAAYWSAGPLLPLIGTVERIFAITCQIALSVLVLQAFTRRQPAWIAAAVLYHALLDATAVYFAAIWRGQPWGTLAVEGIIGLGALIGLGIIFALRQPEPPPEPDEVEILAASVPPPPARIADILKERPEIEVGEDSLDNSRYSS